MSSGIEERWYRRCRLVLPWRSTCASTTAMARRPGKRSSPGRRRAVFSQPTSWLTRFVADPVAAELDAAVLAIGGLEAAVDRGVRVVEGARDLVVQARLVGLEREQIVAASLEDGLSNPGLGAHGVEGGQRAGQR